MPKRSFSQWYHEVTAGLSLSIRTRVILSYLIIVGMAFLFLTRKISHEVHPRYLKAEEETMNTMARLLAGVIAGQNEPHGEVPGATPPSFAAVEAAFPASGSGSDAVAGLRIRVADPSGRILFDSGHGDPAATALRASAPIRDGERITGTVTITKPLALMHQKRIFILGTAAAVGVVLLGVIFSAWLTYPIRNLIGYAQAIRDGRRTPRPHLGHSEMRTLGLAFEEMRDALEGKDYVNRYLQTLTHEMKSPVAAIQGAAELLQEEMPAEDRQRFLANIRTESARLREAVDSLLLLASVESRKTLDTAAAVDLCKLVESVVEKLTVQISVKALEITRDFPATETPVVNGDAFLLERTVLNLLENAIAFSPEGGAIALGIHRQEGNWEVAVEDRGPGVPAYALARVFERFYSLPRPDTGKKSSGLGLAFVQEVATLHGGTVSLENRGEGGARVAISLPEEA